MKYLSLYILLLTSFASLWAIEADIISEESLQLGTVIEDILQEVEEAELPIVEQIVPVIEHTALTLESYHQRQYDMIFDFLPVDTSEQISEIAKLEIQIRRIERLLGRIENASDYVAGEYEDIGDTITNFTSLIAETEEDLLNTNRAIATIKASMYRNLGRIIQTVKQIDEIERKVKNNREVLSAYVSYLSASGDVLYSDLGEIDILRSVILSGQDSGSILNDQYLGELLAITWYSLVEENDTLLEDLELKKDDLQNTRDKQSRQEARLETYQTKLEVQNTHKNKILSFAQKHEQTLETNLEKINDDKRKLNNDLLHYLRIYETELKEIHTATGCSETIQLGQCEQVEKYFSLETQLLEAQNSKDTNLIWPVEPKNGISAYYHDREYHNQFKTFHKALDIPVEQETPVQSIENGYVVALLPADIGTYGMVAIKHLDGYVSVYGHLSEISVEQFQMVTQAQVIGLSGWEPGTPWAGNITTGPHLHFELYYQKEDVDPLEHLDTTKIHPSKIDKLYGFKYLEDTRARYGEDVDTRKLREIIDVFQIEGDTEIDRQRYFLQTYAHRDFASVGPWIQAGVDHGIDPSFLICIGFSESTLGNYLKSRYNIGNVGNNDSGDVVLFASAYQGISAVANVLNNQYLGDYTILRDLSGWWSKDGLKYATSPQNWHRNNVQCVSALKESYVTHEYQFRIPVQTREAYENKIRLQG